MPKTDAPALFSEEFTANPYPTYRALRENEPVVCKRYAGERMQVWFVSRYEDVRAAFRDPRFRKSRESVSTGGLANGRGNPELAAFHRTLIMLDPPEHTTLRRLVAKEFTPRRIRAMADKAAAYADRLVAGFRPDGKAELVGDLAVPLCYHIIGGMLGSRPEDDWPGFDWNRLRVLGNRLTTPDNSATTVDYDEIKFEIKALVDVLIARRRENPGPDVFSALIAATDRGELSADQLFGLVVTLVLGGMDTTAAFLGNALLALLLDPGQLELLRSRPELMDNAVEELLRFDGAMQTASFRFTSEDVELGGTVIPRGAVVALTLAAANRDPERFPDPDRLDITRDAKHHVALGHGIHNCLGAELGRMLTRITLETVLRRLPGLALAAPPDTLDWRPGILLRAVRELPVTFTDEERR